LTFAINGAGLVTSLASCALLTTVTLAVLVTPEFCCTVLLTIATAAVLIALLLGSDYHLFASTQLFAGLLFTVTVHQWTGAEKWQAALLTIVGSSAFHLTFPAITDLPTIVCDTPHWTASLVAVLVA